MTPTFLVITCAVGLLPLLLRFDGDPTWAPPFLVALDAIVRFTAVILGLALIGYVAAVGLGDHDWDLRTTNVAVGIVAAIMSSLAIQFLLLVWPRLVVATNPGMEAGATNPRTSTATVTLVVVAILVALGTLTLVEVLLAQPKQPRGDLVIGAAQMTLVLIALLASAAATMLWLSRRIDDAPTIQPSLAKHLDGTAGLWEILHLTPDGVGHSEPPLEIWILAFGPKWFCRFPDAYRIIEFRADAAARPGPPPALSLHARKLTVWPNNTPARCFGFRLWDSDSRKPFQRLKAHYGSPFDRDRLSCLPRKTEGSLIPIDADLLLSAGLKSELVVPAQRGTHSPDALPVTQVSAEANPAVDGHSGNGSAPEPQPIQ